MTSRVASRKILLLGEIGVGKTSLVRRLTLGELPTDYRPTMGVDIYTYRLPASEHAREKVLDLVIWDLDGSYGPSIFRHVYCQGASGALIIGDVKRPATLTLMSHLGEAFESAMPSRYCSFVLNKTDLIGDRGEIELPAAVSQARHPVVWTSALTGDGVASTFGDAGNEIRRRSM